MKFVRLRYENGSRVGLMQGSMVKVLSETLSMLDIAAMSRSSQLAVMAREEAPMIPMSEVHVLAPVMPRQLIAVGANYYAHVEEAQHHVP
jgi:2-keto-4-pentenoate hydratase/2-oxohepta-3-ene-1,7-dioic acid hydratase in catechol pathway